MREDIEKRFLREGWRSIEYLTDARARLNLAPGKIHMLSKLNNYYSDINKSRPFLLVTDFCDSKNGFVNALAHPITSNWKIINSIPIILDRGVSFIDTNNLVNINLDDILSKNGKVPYGEVDPLILEICKYRLSVKSGSEKSEVIENFFRDYAENIFELLWSKKISIDLRSSERIVDLHTYKKEEAKKEFIGHYFDETQKQTVVYFDREKLFRSEIFYKNGNGLEDDVNEGEIFTDDDDRKFLDSEIGDNPDVQVIYKDSELELVGFNNMTDILHKALSEAAITTEKVKPNNENKGDINKTKELEKKTTTSMDMDSYFIKNGSSLTLKDSKEISENGKIKFVSDFCKIRNSKLMGSLFGFSDSGINRRINDYRLILENAGILPDSCKRYLDSGSKRGRTDKVMDIDIARDIVLGEGS